MKRVALALLLVAAACGGSGTKSLSVTVDVPGYVGTPLSARDASAFERTYEREVGADDVAVVRVTPPPSSPPAPLNVVALRFDHTPGPGILRQLASHVPLSQRVTTHARGLTFVEQRRDGTFASTVVWLGGRDVVVVYGGVIADEEKLAASAVRHVRQLQPSAVRSLRKFSRITER